MKKCLYSIRHPDRIRLADILKNQHRCSTGTTYLRNGVMRHVLHQTVPSVQAVHRSPITAWRTIIKVQRLRDRHWRGKMARALNIYVGLIGTWEMVPQRYVPAMAKHLGCTPADVRPDLYS